MKNDAHLKDKCKVLEESVAGVNVCHHGLMLINLVNKILFESC